MDKDNCIEQYEKLIKNADVHFCIQKGVTRDGGQDIIESLTYNGYLNVLDFKAKLTSLSILIRRNIETYYELKEIGLLTLEGIDIFNRLTELKYIFSDTLTHNNFKFTSSVLLIPNETLELQISQFILVAKENLDTLLKEPVMTIENILVDINNLKLVDRLLKENGVVDNMGVCMLTERKTSFLWAVIDCLKDKEIINITPHEKIIGQAFWIYIKGKNKLPYPPHRNEKGYEKKVKDANAKYERISSSFDN